MAAPRVFQELLDGMNEAFARLDWQRIHAAALAQELSKPPAPGGLFSAPPVPPGGSDRE